MGLDDREQQILAEIERQFYEEDPSLADAVRTISRRSRPWEGKVAALGVVIGVALVAFTFLFNTVLALVGFLITVGSVTWLVSELRGRRGTADAPVSSESGRNRGPLQH